MRVTDDFVFFFGKNEVFSNFYRYTFKHKDVFFATSEHAVMYEKAILFGAVDIANQILETYLPQDCKQLGRSKRIPFNQGVWDENKERIYKEVLISKFSNPYLKPSLLETGTKTLVEASPFDHIWGIKMGENHPDVTNPSKWRGQNLLGKVLMEVRSELIKTKSS